MKRGIPILLILAASFAGLAATLMGRAGAVDLFVLKAGGPEAFRVQAYLNGQEPLVETIPLSPSQRKMAQEILTAQDVDRLSRFGRGFGKFQGVVGVPQATEAWPWFFGEMPSWPRIMEKGEDFGDLQWSDKLYLAWSMKVPPPPSLETPPSPPSREAGAEPVVAKVTATPAAAAVLRVEIKNGCGITNAAEWVARRLQGTRLQVVRTGNADSFRYSKTLLKTGVGSSVALDEALERLGLDPSRVTETTAPDPQVDVVIIVGRDFPKLRERWRERDRH